MAIFTMPAATVAKLVLIPLKPEHHKTAECLIAYERALIDPEHPNLNVPDKASPITALVFRGPCSQEQRDRMIKLWYHLRRGDML